MRYATAEDLKTAIPALLKRDPTLSAWGDADRRKILRFWYRKGDKEALLALLQTGQTGWSDVGWPIVAGDMARRKEYEQAWRLAGGKIHVERPIREETYDEPRLRTLFSEQNTPDAAERVASVLFGKGDWEGVLKFALQARTVSKGTATIARLASVSAARLGRWPEAWNRLAEAIRLEDPNAAPE
jgi:hypothetical protein